MSDLTRDDIEQIMELVEKSHFDELNFEMGGLKLSLRKSPATTTSTAATPQPTLQPVAETAATPVASPAVTGGTPVPSPLLGTFYHAPKPGADPFIKVGDVITETSVIGIVEVMKLMNQVQAGVAGTVIEITAPNGQLVEHGQTLILVEA
jgi:acetyl-CoA carboxylase biotin carboxyl carrier protein